LGARRDADAKLTIHADLAATYSHRRQSDQMFWKSVIT
jgi:hypothetical protein